MKRLEPRIDSITHCNFDDPVRSRSLRNVAWFCMIMNWSHLEQGWALLQSFEWVFSTYFKVFEACYMSSICHGIWVVRQYDILVLTNDNSILLMTRPMLGPDKQFLSSSNNWRLHYVMSLLEILWKSCMSLALFLLNKKWSRIISVSLFKRPPEYAEYHLGK